MTFAALIRIYSIIYPSQYEKLQALQKIAKKKKSIFCKFPFFNTFGALNKVIKNKIAVISNMGL